LSAPAAAAEEVVVFAASSLKEAFEGLTPGFEKAHPGVRVRLSLAGSQELRTQLEQGARADVYAAADRAHMEALERQGLVTASQLFARNEPVIVVPRDNPGHLRSFTDLASTKRLVIGAPEVPIGRYTARIFEAAGKQLGAAFRAGLEAGVVSRELNVRQVLAKVVLGEADAGIVYRTDALAAKDRVAVLAIPPGLNVLAEYPVAPLRSAPHQALARAWIDLVLSPEGQRRLQGVGFLPVPVPTAAVPFR
jgi:molybdate transport system substrate-binding protein